MERKIFCYVYDAVLMIIKNDNTTPDKMVSVGKSKSLVNAK